jgi:NADH dehydrogenase FAD-containing subunit
MVRTRVVIVGGGAAGASVARLLSKTLKKMNEKTGSKHELLLINPRPFDIWLPSLVRVAVTNEGGIDEVNKGAFTSYGWYPIFNLRSSSAQRAST